ncbi:twin-arginine translocation signal domain-containing protein [Luteibacter yeojuensis]|uniref:Twin-arginine translocation signal domain-containing protein n=1 Tax=Luteibacter yeojuensis TaxID=345309 RepID=A0A7X5TPL3_9GAMM|nr:twin-arginine translocation signal domain-containing protein [Luteibacter yeojuensis]NID14597.1 twin-arginine translocation signal domain-containing protein [Luteibacter yeojuensis]
MNRRDLLKGFTVATGALTLAGRGMAYADKANAFDHEAFQEAWRTVLLYSDLATPGKRRPGRTRGARGRIRIDHRGVHASNTAEAELGFLADGFSMAPGELVTTRTRIDDRRPPAGNA